MILNARKKPITVQALQFTGNNLDEVSKFCNDAKVEFACSGSFVYYSVSMKDNKCTSGNVFLVRVTDWIIRGPIGDFYPMHDDVFNATYQVWFTKK